MDACGLSQLSFSARMLPFLLLQTALACHLDSNLHGTYKKQSTSLGRIVFDNSIKDPVVFDDVTVTATSISEYGECFSKSADSFIFALKRMGRPPCFRCVTPITRTPNILQIAHQQEDICHETAEEARLTCFDATLVSATDGFLLFRSENVNEASCGLDGRFSIGYDLRGGDLNCAVDGGSTADSCDDVNLTRIHFRNCSFPDFEMSLRCIGSWQDRDGRHLTIFLNEENGEYRCGLVSPLADDLVLHLANDSSCGRLSPQSAFEFYTFRPESSPSAVSACSFPEWLRGEYDILSVSASVLRYSGPGAAPVMARCVHVEGERILVHSKTKCGDDVGFHCLWFRARSDSLIEFKTTTALDSASEDACSDKGELSTAPWTTALVKKPSTAPCGLCGMFSTPAELKERDCYNVSVDCSRSDSMRVAAFDCQSGVVYDSRSYSCVASWRDDEQLFVYATRARDTHTCFALRYDGGRLFFASTGSHCARGFNFTENTEKTIVLAEQTNKAVLPSTLRPKPARRPVSVSVTRIYPTNPPTTTPVTEESTEESPSPAEPQTSAAMAIGGIVLLVGMMDI